MIEIKNRKGDVIHRSETATTIREAVERAVHEGASLFCASLSCADLSGAILSGADLIGAYLIGAELDGAILDGASLSGADLYCADLHGASLIGAALSCAELDGASLIGASLIGATIDDGVTLTEADCSLPLHLMSEGNLGIYWLHIFGPYAKIGCHVKRIEDWLNYKTKSLTESEMRPYKAFLKWVLTYRNEEEAK